MSLSLPLTAKTRLVFRFIEKNPSCTQQDIIIFLGERGHTQQCIYKLLSFDLIKYKLGKGNKKHYYVNHRKNFY